MLSPVRLVAVLVGLLAVTLLVLYVVPSDDYILLPDSAHPVAPLVRVQGGHDPRPPGGVYFVDVFERKASVLESLFPSIRRGATLVPADLIVPPGVTDAEAHSADLRAMSISQRIAAAVALRQLGYKVVTRPSGVIIAAVATDSHAAGKVKPGDVITSVNEKPTLQIAQLRTALAQVKPGEVVRLGIERGGEHVDVSVKTVADPRDKERALVGFTPDQAATIKLPVKVQIDAGNVGGPSAGLAFALDVMEELGRDVDHGYKVAATGQINLDGSVSPIGGVKQKTYGARKTGVDVFLVPAGENAREARRYADGLRIIPVQSFPQALRALATLPPKE